MDGAICWNVVRVDEPVPRERLARLLARVILDAEAEPTDALHRAVAPGSEATT